MTQPNLADPFNDPDDGADDDLIDDMLVENEPPANKTKSLAERLAGTYEAVQPSPQETLRAQVVAQRDERAAAIARCANQFKPAQRDTTPSWAKGE